MTDSVSPFGSLSLASTAIVAVVPSAVVAVSFAATGPSFARVTFTSSIPASTMLAAASAASTRIRIVWPANAFRLTLAADQTASSLLAAPSSSRTTAVVAPTIVTRR